MTPQEKEAKDKALESLCHDFTREQTLTMAFTIASTIAKLFLRTTKTKEELMEGKEFICEYFIDKLTNDVANYQLNEL